MNIFVLDDDPVLAAQYQCDKHVVKMTLETAQLLSTAYRSCSHRGCETLYKSTHINHPCTVWVTESRANYRWLFAHFRALADEYRYRYYKTHASWDKLADALSVMPSLLPNKHMTPFAQAMPERYKQPNAVDAYRAYYMGEKADFLAYTRRDRPSWMTP